MRKKLVNLDNPNCVFCANLRTGNVSACWIRLSIWLSFPSLNPCSANIASRFCFAASLCLSKVSLTAKFSWIAAKEPFNPATCEDILVNCAETLLSASEFCCNKLVVCGSGWAWTGAWRPLKILEDTVLLTALIHVSYTHLTLQTTPYV